MVVPLMVCHSLFDPFIVLRAELGSRCVWTQVLDKSLAAGVAWVSGGDAAGGSICH